MANLPTTDTNRPYGNFVHFLLLKKNHNFDGYGGPWFESLRRTGPHTATGTKLMITQPIGPVKQKKN